LAGGSPALKKAPEIPGLFYETAKRISYSGLRIAHCAWKKVMLAIPRFNP
jgi:hypothetical protein